MTGSLLQREYGDYQTPEWFSDEVCSYLRNILKLNPTKIIEPTCGLGNFVKSSIKQFPKAHVTAIDINKDYIVEASTSIVSDNVEFVTADFFNYDFTEIARNHKPMDSLLIIGNPPWVTNSTLSSLESNNSPIKSNFKKLNGFDAITGSSNFDICEYMLLSLIKTFNSANAVIAMLCKTSVARNVIQELDRNSTGFYKASLLIFNAKAVFGVSVDSGLLVIQFAPNSKHSSVCSVYEFDSPESVQYTFGVKNGLFYSKLDDTAPDYDGKSCFKWRQGIKHDCSKIMELKKCDDLYINGFGKQCDLESEYVFPLVKSSSVKNCVIDSSDRYVLVTQRKIGADTQQIRTSAPKTWSYLKEYATTFENRKSSIYKNAPIYAMFGVGDYSFSKFKVGVSGFYKEPRFALLANEKPIMMDDTCYFLSFDSYDDAYVVMLMLNSDKVQRFIKSISFSDSKRPYTKKVLGRIDFSKCYSDLSFEDLKAVESMLGLESYLTKKAYDELSASISLETRLAFAI